MILRSLRRIACLAALLLAGACAAPGGTPGPAVAAPDYRAGDRWVYRVEDGFRIRTIWEETHSVVDASPQSISVRVRSKGPTIDDERMETWSAPGVVQTGAVFDNETRRFDPALVRFQFPLTGGSTWRQQLRDLGNDTRPYGGVQRTVTVGGYERVTTPAGTFDAVRMQIFMRLDDEAFWRYPTDCTYVVWYAPQVGATVREEKYAYYSEKGGFNGGGRLVTQQAVVELVSFARPR